MDPANPQSRNNAKTVETARHGYSKINPESGSANDGIIAKLEPQNLVTYFENKLIMAEAAARAGGLADGLPHLNDVRAWLNGGGNLNSNYIGLAHRYDSYVAADFAAGGIENQDNVAANTAFLREVIEERYVSGFGMHMPFNDARRLRTETAVAVPYVMVGRESETRKPQRMLWATVEINSNDNVPELPDLTEPTEVNR